MTMDRSAVRQPAEAEITRRKWIGLSGGAAGLVTTFATADAAEQSKDVTPRSAKLNEGRRIHRLARSSLAAPAQRPAYERQCHLSHRLLRIGSVDGSQSHAAGLQRQGRRS